MMTSISPTNIVAILREHQVNIPNLDLVRIRAISGQGQNNALFVVGERYVVRVPRYQDGIAKLDHEIAILRAISGRLPLATPEPFAESGIWAESGTGCLIYPLIAGEPLTLAALRTVEDPVAHRLGEEAGTFLRALHFLAIDDILAKDKVAFEPTAAWRNVFDRIKHRLFPFVRADARLAITTHFEEFFERAPSLDIVPTVTHGDFGTSNLLWDPATGHLTGVVDFSNAGIGDPVVDLAALPEQPAAFTRGVRGSYPFPPHAEERIRFYRGTFALQEALFGSEQGDHGAFDAGIASYR